MSASDQPIVMTLELVQAMLRHIAPVDWVPVITACLSVRYEMAMDVEIDLSVGWHTRGADVKVSPHFWDCRVPRDQWRATAEDIAKFLCSIKDGKMCIFAECSVDIVETVYGESESS
jgi:hypothetical protein